MTQGSTQSVASFLDTVAQKVPQFAIAIDAHRKGELVKARAAYLDLVDEPRLTGLCLHQLGLVAAQGGNVARAIDLFRAALRFDPEQPIYHANLCAALERLDLRVEALEALTDLGLALDLSGQHGRSLATWKRVIERDGNNFAGHFGVGAALIKMDEIRAAIPHLVKGIALCLWRHPCIGRLLDSLSSRLSDHGLIGQDIAQTAGISVGYAKGLEGALSNLGLALGSLGFADEEIRCHRAAMEIEPSFAGAHFNLAIALLRKGDFEEGWREYEWRWRWRAFGEPRRNLNCPPWQGEPLEGKTILVYVEQGWGDAIQFVPLLASLRAARRIVVEVTLPLVALFTAYFAAENVDIIPRTPDFNRLNTDQPLDFSVALMSLPALLRLRLHELPLATEYLKGQADAVAAWRGRIAAARLRVGLAWAGSPTHANDRNRSIAFTRLAPIFEIAGVDWYSLQVGPHAADAHIMPGKVRDISESLKDFTDTAAVIANLDMVITVDTAVAHLTAAMGQPCWVMLPSPADWRWLAGRTDSPWYPTARLFRQRSPGDWDSVVAEVATELASVLNQNFPRLVRL